MSIANKSMEPQANGTLEPAGGVGDAHDVQLGHGERVLYIAYTDPAAYPPLHHSARMIAASGVEVVILGVRVPSVEALRFPAHERITLKYFPAFRAGWRQKAHYAAFCAWVMFWTLRARARWIYASEATVTPAALVASYVPGVRVIYHEHDSPTPVQRGRASLFSRLTWWARQRLATRASLCVLPQQDRATWFRSTLGTTRVACVWNCPSREEVGAAERERNDSELRIVYQGSIVPDRLPLTVAHALCLLPPQVTLHVIGYATQERQGYVDEFLTLCETIGVRGRVQFYGVVPERSELLSLCRTFDIGLAFIREGTTDLNMRWMVGASNKPFDYLACGLPLLVTDNPAWRSMYADAGYAVACDPDSAESVASAVRWYLEHPQARMAMGVAGRQRIATDWNYESQFAPVLKHLLGK